MNDSVLNTCLSEMFEKCDNFMGIFFSVNPEIYPKGGFLLGKMNGNFATEFI